MTLRRRGIALVAGAALVPAFVAAGGGRDAAEAVADLGVGAAAGPAPATLPTPYYADAAPRGAVAAPRILRAVRAAEDQPALRAALGGTPARIVQAGPLQSRGQTVGVTALLALGAARHDVRIGHDTVPVLRDLLVDAPSSGAPTLQPGPASRTSTWHGGPPRAAAAAATAAGTSPAFVRLSPGGPAFAPYDGTPAAGAAGRDWPVSLVFAGNATVDKVKRALRTAGLTRAGERRALAYRTAGGGVRFDTDRGLKTRCDANGTDVHVRLYAPPATDHFTDPRYGRFVVATAHLDRAEGCGAGPQVFGFSEEAERRVAAAVHAHAGWRVQPDAIALHNAEPYRRDLTATNHLWWADGRATLVQVP